MTDIGTDIGNIWGNVWLLRPWWLMSLAFVAALAWLLWKFRRAGGVWARYVDVELLSALQALGRITSRPPATTIACALAVSAIIIVALSGPALRNTSVPSFKNLEGIVIVMDMSPSVSRTGALDDAKALAARVVQTAAGRAVSLILFAGEAYTVNALSEDTSPLETSISVLDGEIMPDQGSRPDRGLQMAHTILKDAGIKGGDVILISDGGGLGPGAFSKADEIRGARRTAERPAGRTGQYALRRSAARQRSAGGFGAPGRRPNAGGRNDRPHTLDRTPQDAVR